MLDTQRSEKFEMSTVFRVSILFFSLLLVYDYYFTTTLFVYRVTDPQFSLLSPNNTFNYVNNDTYNQLIDIKNFTFRLNPKPCQDYTEGLLLVIIVTSNPTNYENRMIIRNTWGRSTDSTKIVFLVGEVNDDITSQKMLNESSLFGDIVQGSFTDAYRNMTYKHVMGLKWVAHHCPLAKYVLKTDDDVLVNIHGLRHFLARQMSPWGAKGLIACQVSNHAQVQRSHRSKWRVSPMEYQGYYYPRYCAGFIILYSQDVIHQLLQFTQEAPYFWIDDVHITGVAAESVGVARTHLGKLILSNHQVTRGVDKVGPFLFGPPDLSPSQIVDIWKAIPE